MSQTTEGTGGDNFLRAELDLESLFLENVDALYRYALRRVGQEYLAEELIQEAFLGAARYVEAYEGRSEPKYWILAILKNKIADYFEKETRAKTAFPIVDSAEVDDFFAGMCWSRGCGPKHWELDPESLLQHKDFVRIVEKCVDDLPEKSQKVFKLKAFNDLSVERVHNSLGLSAGNIRVIMHRARVLIRACIENRWTNAK